MTVLNVDYDKTKPGLYYFLIENERTPKKDWWLKSFTEK